MRVNIVRALIVLGGAGLLVATGIAGARLRSPVALAGSRAVARPALA